MTAKNQLIGAEWRQGRGEQFDSTDPATGAVIWTGHSASREDVDAAVGAARTALADWANHSGEERAAILEAFAKQVAAQREALAELISRETGKPLWETLGEVDAMRGKVPISIEASAERRKSTTRKIGDAEGFVRYKPHGVVAVLGPYNFPGHLPNGHIVPALLAGNTVVFKPSELTPAVGEMTVKLWIEAGLPSGVINLVQGAREPGETLVTHPRVDGVFFTGSLATGRAINRALADHPGKIVALEMGGNNPLVVHRTSDLVAAAYAIVESAYITAGQRCSCARRLIVLEPEANALLSEIRKFVERMIIGPYTLRPEPFMGPLISPRAAEQVLAAQAALQSRGALPLIQAHRMEQSPAFLTPGLIDVTPMRDRPDEEIFGPLLQVIRVNDFDEAIAECNRTCYGLAAGLISDEGMLFERFFRDVRAGVVNFNRPLTGASSWLPFGGIGCSGNHRPSAYFASDYCSYPVASMEAAALPAPAGIVGFH